jgi:hypothetical protein
MEQGNVVGKLLLHLLQYHVGKLAVLGLKPNPRLILKDTTFRDPEKRLQVLKEGLFGYAAGFLYLFFHPAGFVNQAQANLKRF